MKRLILKFFFGNDSLVSKAIELSQIRQLGERVARENKELRAKLYAGEAQYSEYIDDYFHQKDELHKAFEWPYDN